MAAPVSTPARLPISQRLAFAMWIKPHIPAWCPEIIVAGCEHNEDEVRRLWKEHVHSSADLQPVAELLCEVFGENAIERALHALEELHERRRLQ